jgi:two-component system NtrC family response regulator
MPSVLIIDDKDSLRDMLTKTLTLEGFDVETAADGGDAIKLADTRRFDVVLTDLKLPTMDGIEVLSKLKEMDPAQEVIMMTAFGTIETAVHAMKLGAYDFLTKPFDTDHLTLLLKRALENRRLAAENVLLREALSTRLGQAEIIGTSAKIREVSELVQKVAVSDSTVLLCGESGTGKELFARATHMLSPRRKRAYVTINCAAIPRELLENELFGSERGAFTGAVARKIGKFEIADGGTIFLDEVGDLELSLQAKLLRALQEKQIERLGGHKPVHVDVRVIAATNLDLGENIRQGKFREDLYYRLSVFPITIPPLRERPEDIPVLANHFVSKYATEMKKGKVKLTQDAKALLTRYHWPGNVRELENTIERAMILCDKRSIGPEQLAIRLRRPDEIYLREGAGLKEIGQHAAMEAERATIIRVLKETHGNKRKASGILKIDYTTLFEKLKRYKIDYKNL